VACPYCGERFDAALDCSAGDQEYIEDCRMCCAVHGRTNAASAGCAGAARPIVFAVAADADGRLLSLEVRREDD
jgi:hypothetical protein